MRRTITNAEAYARTLKGQSEEMKQAKLYAKYGSTLGILSCKRIAKNF
tara:strand:+ start:243 stop:386 length:144 start_codon:yes stop_codon:yes gene_type:complete